MMTVIDDIYSLPYCVYAHYVDDEMIYIGSGEIARASNINSRKPEHIGQLSRGKTKVIIMRRFATVEEARLVEVDLIKACKPVHNYQHTRPEIEKVWSESTRDTRPLMSMITGKCYYSAAHAAAETRIPYYKIAKHLAGEIYDAYDEVLMRVDWEISGLDKNKRWSNGVKDRISVGASQQVLDVIVQSIIKGEPSPTNKMLATLTDTTEANVDRAIRHLSDAGLITVIKPSAGVRFFEVGELNNLPTVRRTEEVKMTRQRKAIYDMLLSAAMNGAPCPSNADMAEIIGSGPTQPRKIIARMKHDGLLDVEMVGLDRRVIHIGGFSTAPTPDNNVRGRATTGRVTRARDYIRV